MISNLTFKRSLISFLFILYSYSSFSQITIFQEDFESEISLWNFTSSGTNNWVKNSTFYHGGTSSAHNPYMLNNTNILFTTSSIDLTLITSPILRFWQIAKTEIVYDKCYVEISLDGGTTYDPLPKTTYTGAGNYITEGVGGFFDGSSYGTTGTGTWEAANNYTPTNSWWKQESFNLTPFITYNNVKFRFRLISDGFSNYYGWLIDDITIKGNSTHNTNSTITVGPGVEPETISSLENTAPGVMVFDFLFTDSGGDGVATIIDNLVIKQGASNDFADWLIAIQGATLTAPDLTVYTGNISSTQIEFSGNNFTQINDASSANYELRIWLNPNYLGASEGANFQFKVSAVDILNDPTGSFFLPTATLSSISTVNALSVVASDISFIVQPINTAINNNMNPAVKVAGTDIYKNIDNDFVGQNISLTSTGSMIGSPLTAQTVLGIATYELVKHGALGVGFVLVANYNTWVDTSYNFNIIENSCNIQTNPPSTNGELKMCLGSNSVTMTGLYTGPGTPTYFWELGDGHSASGQTVTQVYDGAFGYNVKLNVTSETTTCTSELKVMISPGPVIGTISPFTPICLGQSVDLSAGGTGSLIQVAPFTGAGVTALSLADTTFLPDTQSGATAYTTTLTYTQFPPSATLTNANLISVYANMEHSWFGDLKIQIKCPNNQQVTIADARDNGGATSENLSTFLGEPVDKDLYPQVYGVGYEYRWTNNNPTYGKMEYIIPPSHTFTDRMGNLYTNVEYFEAGTYTPFQSFSGLVGCPLNGNWTITITDDWASDNGYIFEWGLELDPSLMPSNWNYTTNILSYAWNGPGTIVGTGANVTVTPTAPGNNIYTLSVRDDFYCTTQQNITIPTTSLLYSIPDVVTCNSSTVLDAGEGWVNYVWKDIFGTVLGNSRYLTVNGSGKFYITVSDGNCSGYDVVQVTLGGFTYVPPSPSTFCESSPASILNAGLGYTNYTWTLGGDVVCTTRTFSPTVSGTYTITVQNNQGCISSGDVTVTVIPKPIIDYISSDADNKICNGTSITLTGTGEAISYLWNNGVTNGQSFSPTATTTYTLTGLGANLCESILEVNVEVVQVPTIVIQDVVSCGTTALVNAGTGYTGYQWTNPSGDVIGTTPSIVISTAGLYTIQVANDICFATDQFNVTLGNYTYTPPAAPPTMCTGNTAVLNAGAGYLTYEWKLNNVVVGTSQTYNATQAGTYTISVKNNFNCLLSSEVVVTVFEIPNVQITSTDLDNKICSGDSIAFTATGATSYAWNDINVVNGLYFFPTTSKTYTVIATDSHGCTYPKSVNLVVNQLPSINIANDDLCNGDEVTIDAGAGFTQYLWKLEGNQIGNTRFLVVTQSGNYTITITDNNGCKKTDDFAIGIHDLPVINIDNQEICLGTTFTFDAGSGYTSYDWKNSENEQVAITQTYTTGTAGTYTVAVTNQYDCSNTDAFTVIVNPLPFAYGGPDWDICEGEEVILTATGGVSYSWSNSVIQGEPFYPTLTKTYLVTVYDANDCFSTDIVTVVVNPSPILELPVSNEICLGDTLTLDAGGVYSIYEWSTGQGSPTIDVSEAGTYSLTVYDNKACSTTSQTLLIVNPLPEFNEIYYSNVGEITISAFGGTSPLTYSADNLNFVSDSIFSELTKGHYTITVMDAKGCVVKQEFMIDDIEIFIPQFFTPNFDGTNDTWEIDGIRAFANSDIKIFDRFGKLLAAYNGLETGWDGTYRGKVLPSDSYWYVIDLKYEGKIYSGYVTIKRDKN